jgi:hypothetical protein
MSKPFKFSVSTPKSELSPQISSSSSSSPSNSLVTASSVQEAVSQFLIADLAKIVVEYWRMYSFFFFPSCISVYFLLPSQDSGFHESKLITPEQGKQVSEWYGQDVLWKLLFRASEHGYSCSEFHRLCDDKGPTMVFVKTPNVCFSCFLVWSLSLLSGCFLASLFSRFRITCLAAMPQKAGDR